jgi:hypothetical protein
MECSTCETHALWLCQLHHRALWDMEEQYHAALEVSSSWHISSPDYMVLTSSGFPQGQEGVLQQYLSGGWIIRCPGSRPAPDTRALLPQAMQRPLTSDYR